MNDLVNDIGAMCAEKTKEKRALFLLHSYGSLQRRMWMSFKKPHRE